MSNSIVHKVLLAVDESEQSRHAVGTAAVLAAADVIENITGYMFPPWS